MDSFPPVNTTRRKFFQATAVTAGLAATGLLNGAPAHANGFLGQDIVSLSAIDLSNAIRTRKVSCREVMTAYLAQIDRVNPKANAIVSLQDPEGLLRQADERDQRLSSGTYMGWMHGFPQAPKDIANTAGILTTQGSPILKN